MAVKRGLAIAAAGAVLGVLVLGLWLPGWLAELQTRVEARFQGRLFAVPSRVYSAPLVLYPGLSIEAAGVRERLQRMNYHPIARMLQLGDSRLQPGEYLQLASSLEIGRRAFRYPHRYDPGGHTELRLDAQSRIRSIRGPDGAELDTVELEPEVVARFRGDQREDRKLVRLAELPTLLVRAVLAVEDQAFYTHRGLHPRRILGAALANLRAGRVVQGGSTLTQQLVKNFYLTRERTLSRKAVEAVMALILERNHTKDEILEAYLNEVYLGQRGSVGIHGVGEAAQFYFAKDVRALELHEQALLAALIKGPSYYAPRTRPEAARARRDLVLRLLAEAGDITPDEHARAAAADLGVREPPREENAAPYFVEYVRRAVAAEHGQEILESENLAIFSTLDPQLQRRANAAVANGLARLEADFPQLVRAPPDVEVVDATVAEAVEADPEPASEPAAQPGPVQAALIALQPRTGEVLALVGGRDWQLSQFDRATQARRQPGSVFKPVVALAALVGEGARFTLASQLSDEPLRVALPGGDWLPTNYDGEFRGPVTLRRAVEESLNVPIARLGLETGPLRIIATARALGFESPLEPVPSLALGAFEVTLLETARAYATLAAGGVVPVLRSYTEVLDGTGLVLQSERRASERSFRPEEAHLITSLLRGAVERGTAKGLAQWGLGGLAAKTGTSSDFRDAWFVGYTPELVVAVWVGFDDGTSLGVPGSVAALPIFAELMQGAVDATGGVAFAEPPGLERVAIDPNTGLRASLACPGPRELFLPGTAPATTCRGRAAGDGPSLTRSVGRTLERVFGWFGGER